MNMLHKTLLQFTVKTKTITRAKFLFARSMVNRHNSPPFPYYPRFVSSQSIFKSIFEKLFTPSVYHHVYTYRSARLSQPASIFLSRFDTLIHHVIPFFHGFGHPIWCWRWVRSVSKSLLSHRG